MKRYLLVAALAALTMPAHAAKADDCSKAVAQPDMNACADKAFQAADKKLNEVYKKVVAGEEGDTAKLKAAQRLWVQFRDAECTFEVEADEGGSIYPMEYSNCLEKVTRIRIKEFEDYLACQKDAAKCGG